MARTDTLERDSIALVQKALAEIRGGRMVILTDDEARENEGDLVMAAEKVTPQAINFMATHGRGLICLSMTEDRIRKLNLPLMVQENTSPFGTAFTVSIEAASGVTTGISAADRAHTIRVAVAPDAKPGDLVRPGHVFPLRARNGGVLVRAGQTEGSVDLARMAGLAPAGVICEIMNPDGTMARRQQLLRFARRHRLTMLSVADIIRYRLRHDRLVRRVAASSLPQFGGGEFQAIAYQSDVEPGVHVALVRGEVAGKEPILTRVHRACLAGDLLGSTACDCGTQLQQAIKRIRAEERGVIVYLQREVPPPARLECTHRWHDDERRPGEDRGRFREFGIGAQILRDLGLHRLRLLTNNPKKIVGLQSYDLEVIEQVPLQEAAETPPQRRLAAARRARGVRRPGS
ncbi:MAG TPA: 3,4-dihydroxy-2-butanone-4-phosphate synthase [Myxococcaceae bacterium]|nr:3,4-dihydroxy-2-butanone-4-phosphate synthase [Myxococcaceae bacterium]